MRICNRMEECFNVDRVGFGGELGLLWKEGVSVTLLSYFVGHINGFVTFSFGKKIHFTGFYGN